MSKKAKKPKKQTEARGQTVVKVTGTGSARYIAPPPAANSNE